MAKIDVRQPLGYAADGTALVTETAFDSHASRHGLGGADSLGALFRSGRYKVGAYVAPAGAASTYAGANNEERCIPLWVAKTISVDRISLEVTILGETGASLRLGVRSDDGTGYPGSVLVDSGSLAAGTGDGTGAKEFTINPAQVLTAGLYWLSCTMQNATTTRPTVRAIGGTLDPVLGSANNTSQHSGYSQTGVTGALGAFSSTLANAVPAPFVKLRVSVA